MAVLTMNVDNFEEEENPRIRLSYTVSANFTQNRQ